MTSTDLENAVIAVDGGGTTCRLVLAGAGRIWRTTRGPTNVTTDFAAALSELTAGLGDLAHQGGISLQELAHVPAYLGLAGVTGTDLAEQVRTALPLVRATVEDDRRAALVGALAGGEGVVAHCGTGSFLAARVDGRERLVGGWGLILGDVASAAWVGRRALSRALDAVDGLIEDSALARDLVATFDDPPGVVTWAAQAGPAEFGALARRVSEAAATGDGLGVAVLNEAAGDLAGVIRRLGWRPGLAICLTGGIGGVYGDHLPGDLRADLAKPAGDPIDGAVALARRLADGADTAGVTGKEGRT